MNILKDERVYSFYSAIKNEEKFRNLDMSEKLHLLERLGKVIIAYHEAGLKDKIELLCPEIVVDSISARGFNRTRQVLKMCDDLEIKLREFKLAKNGEFDFKNEWNKKIFHL